MTEEYDDFMNMMGLLAKSKTANTDEEKALLYTEAKQIYNKYKWGQEDEVTTRPTEP